MQVITLGHSPDADDAFMFYALAMGQMDTGDWVFAHVLRDIQTLNQWARSGLLDVTAISVAAYPFAAAHYELLPCGASVGEGYGPIVVTREPLAPDELRGRTVAVPGPLTTAYLTLCLLLGPSAFRGVPMPFDAILGAVARGEVDAGLVIHEGQITYERLGLYRSVDLGAWWQQETGLPLPLGLNAARRGLGRRMASLLRQAVEFALERRSEALAYAGAFARGLPPGEVDRFVGMYVNGWTVDLGSQGRAAVEALLRRGAEAGLLPAAEVVWAG